MTDKTRNAWQRITDYLSKREVVKEPEPEPVAPVIGTAHKTPPPADPPAPKKPKKKTRKQATK